MVAALIRATPSARRWVVSGEAMAALQNPQGARARSVALDIQRSLESTKRARQHRGKRCYIPASLESISHATGGAEETLFNGCVSCMLNTRFGLDPYHVTSTLAKNES